MGRHFQIKFNPNDMKYYLKDLGHGFGTFIKISNWTEIKNNFLLSIGENYIVFTLGVEEDMVINEHTSNKEDEEYNDLINLKIFSGNIRHGKLSFNPKQSPFIIGRHFQLKFNPNDMQYYIFKGFRTWIWDFYKNIKLD